MRRALAVVTLAMQVSTFAYAQTAPDSVASTEASIRARLEEGKAAWNRGELNSYLDGYLDSDRTRWASGGIVLRGKNAIARAFRARFPTPAEMGHFEVSQMEIDVLGSNDALVFAHWSHTAAQATRKGHFTIHLKKVDGQWYVFSDHTSANP